MDYKDWLSLLDDQYFPSEIYRTPWEYARYLRNNYPDPGLANAEHYLWGREQAADNPLMGLFGPILAGGYYGAKKAGLVSGRSPATLEQLMAGSSGYLSGIFGE